MQRVFDVPQAPGLHHPFFGEHHTLDATWPIGDVPADMYMKLRAYFARLFEAMAFPSGQIMDLAGRFAIRARTPSLLFHVQAIEDGPSAGVLVSRVGQLSWFLGCPLRAHRMAAIDSTWDAIRELAALVERGVSLGLDPLASPFLFALARLLLSLVVEPTAPAGPAGGGPPALPIILAAGGKTTRHVPLT